MWQKGDECLQSGLCRCWEATAMLWALWCRSSLITEPRSPYPRVSSNTFLCWVGVRSGKCFAYCYPLYLGHYAIKRWLQGCHRHELWYCFILSWSYSLCNPERASQKIEGLQRLLTPFWGGHLEWAITASFQRWTPWMGEDKSAFTYPPQGQAPRFPHDG